MAAPTNRDSDKFIVRLPAGMRDRIKDAADTHGRTMNAEVVARLEATFVDDIDAPTGAHLEALAEMESLMRVLLELVVETNERLSHLETSVDAVKRLAGADPDRLPPPDPSSSS